jgi:hypothetical protein
VLQHAGGSRLSVDYSRRVLESGRLRRDERFHVHYDAVDFAFETNRPVIGRPVDRLPQRWAGRRCRCISDPRPRSRVRVKVGYKSQLDASTDTSAIDERERRSADAEQQEERRHEFRLRTEAALGWEPSDPERGG